MMGRFIVAALGLGLLLLASPAGAQQIVADCRPDRVGVQGDASATAVADFAWLEGTWRGPGPGGSTAEAHYLAPRANTLPSVFWLRTDDEVLVIEAVTLVGDEDDVMLYVRHFTPALELIEADRPLTLRLVGREGDRFLFQNLYDENPRCSIIERMGPDRMRSWSLLLRDDGSTAEIHVEYDLIDHR